MASNGNITDGVQKQTLLGTGYTKCPSCNGETKLERECDGVRSNGDAYGCEVYTCKNCSWSTSHKFDDASENYYFAESRREYEEAMKPVVPYRHLNDKLRAKYTKIYNLISPGLVRENMKEDGIYPDEIFDFLSGLSKK